MSWPAYFKEQLVMGNEASSIGVITLWTPKETIASELSKDSFCVCGQLYTKRGITFILRNILANPKIGHLIVCGVDRQGSGDALVKLFKNGVKSSDSGRWQVVGDAETFIDGEITQEAIDLVRKYVSIYDMRGQDVAKIRAKIGALSPTQPFCEPMLFADPVKSDARQFPSDLSVFKIRRGYIGEAWLDALKVVSRFGVEVPGMYGNVKQVHNLAIIIEDEDPDLPKMVDFFSFKKVGLTKYYKGFFDINESKEEAYTYGERIFAWDGIDQEQIMVEKLTRFPYDRGAMAVLWKPHIDNYPPKKTKVQEGGQTKGWRVPCLVMLSAQCMGEFLYMTATFRNNDIYGAWPLNAFALRNFQKKLAKKIGKQLGPLTTISQIAEIYQLDWDESARIVAENDGLEKTCQFDTRGYYVIKLEKSHILATFYTPDGSNILAEYKVDGTKPRAARDLCAQVIKDMLLENLGAAADFGRQLAKAETAVKLHLKFEQDQPLRR